MERDEGKKDRREKKAERRRSGASRWSRSVMKGIEAVRSDVCAGARQAAARGYCSGRAVAKARPLTPAPARLPFGPRPGPGLV